MPRPTERGAATRTPGTSTAYCDRKTANLKNLRSLPKQLYTAVRNLLQPIVLTTVGVRGRHGNGHEATEIDEPTWRRVVTWLVLEVTLPVIMSIIRLETRLPYRNYK